MIVRDLHEKTDEELWLMLKDIDNEPIYWTPVVLAELTRRGLLRIEHLSRRLEKLTIALLFLTIVLALFAAPPAVEVAERWLRPAARTPTREDPSQGQHQAAITDQRTSVTSSDVDQRILDEMKRRGVSRSAAIEQLLRLGITQAVPDSRDPLGLLTDDKEFIESGIQRYMKHNNVSRSEAVERLLHIAAKTDAANPLGLEPPPGAKR
jgi:hypothetical protein